VNEGTILVAANGAFTAGAMTNLGTVTVDGAATFGTLSLGGGTLGGTGDLTVTTDYNGGAGTLGATFSDLSLAKSGAFAADAYTAVDSITLIAGGAVTLNGDLTVAGGSGDSIVVSGSSFQNAGGHAVDPGAGRFLVWSGDPAADTRGGLGYDFKQYNAAFGISPVQGAGNGFLYTAAPVVTAGLTGTVSKVYDATAAAALAPANYTVTGAIDGDTVTLNNPAAGNYFDKNVGSGKTVSVGGLLLASASNGAATVYGYQLGNASASAAIGTLTPASLTGSIAVADKVYDATTDATITGRSLSGVLGGDVVSYVGGTASFDDRNAGVGKLVTATGLGLGGTDAGNYTVNATATTTARITPAPLLIAAATDTKIYDATAISGGVPTVTGLVGSDRVNGLQQSFDSPEVGNRTLGVLGGYTLDDGNGGANYLVSLQTAPGTISPADLPPSALPVVQVPVPESTLTTVDLGTTLYDLNSGQNVALGSNSVPDPGIYLSQDASSVVVVGQSQLGSQVNVASTLLFPAKNYDPGLYVQSETGALYAVEEGTVLDPGVYYDKDSQTVLVVSSNDDGNVTVKSADIKEAVDTVSNGRGTRRVAAVSCR
jgi:hypothetical protein